MMKSRRSCCICMPQTHMPTATSTCKDKITRCGELAGCAMSTVVFVVLRLLVHYILFTLLSVDLTPAGSEQRRQFGPKFEIDRVRVSGQIGPSGAIEVGGMGQKGRRRRLSDLCLSRWME